MYRFPRGAIQFAGIVSCHAASKSPEASYVKWLLPGQDWCLTKDAGDLPIRLGLGSELFQPCCLEADERNGDSSPAPSGFFNSLLDGGPPRLISSRRSSVEIRAFKAALLARNAAPTPSP